MSKIVHKVFATLLQREPNKTDLKYHSNKSYDELYAEVLDCKEYKEVQRNGPIQQLDTKVAVVLSGNIRNLNILPGLTDLCNRYNVDVFAHTWLESGLLNLRNTANQKTPDCAIDQSKQEVEAKLQELPNLKAFAIESNTAFLKSIENIDSELTLLNYSSEEKYLRSQYYSLQRAFDLVEASKTKYDIVIRLRFDTRIVRANLSPFEISNCKRHKFIYIANARAGHNHPPKENETGCYLCNAFINSGIVVKHAGPHTNMICDIMAFGTQAAMKHYCNLYSNMTKYYTKFSKWNEKFISSLTEEDKKQMFIKIDGNVHVFNRRYFDSFGYLFDSTYPEKLLQHHLDKHIVTYSESLEIRYK